MTMTKWKTTIDHWVMAGIALASLSVYALTSASVVTFIDSGELAAVCSILGVAHPTGYPLFTVLGRLVSMIPLGGSDVQRLTLFSALLIALAAGVLYCLLVTAQRADSVFPARSKSPGLPEWVTRFVAAVVALSIGFTPTVWTQGTGVEVYALHYLFLVLMLLLLVKGLESVGGAGKLGDFRWLYLGFYVLGLSFSNHMTTLLLVPALVTLTVLKLGAHRTIHLIPRFLVPLAGGLTAYLYLPVRSSSGVPLDWGHAADAERLWWHVSGKQYRSWIFSGFESASRQLDAYVRNLPAEYGWVLLVAVLLGIFAGWRRRPRLIVFAFVLWISTVFYAINYDIHDIESYYLLTYPAAAILVLEGMLAGARWVRSSLTKPLTAGVIVLTAILPVFMVLRHCDQADESGNTLPDHYSRSNLAAVDSGAVVFSYQWDYFVSPSLYLQHVEGLRPDVTIIDKELLRRSWYFLQLGRQDPDLTGKCRAHVDAFLGELYKFEHDLSYRPEVIEARFNGMINALIDSAYQSRPVYLGPEMEPQFGVGYVRAPETLLYRLWKERAPQSLPPVRIEAPDGMVKGRLAQGLRLKAAEMLTNRGIWELDRREFKSATEHLERALRWLPGYPPALQLLRVTDLRRGE